MTQLPRQAGGPKPTKFTSSLAVSKSAPEGLAGAVRTARRSTRASVRAPKRGIRVSFEPRAATAQQDVETDEAGERPAIVEDVLAIKLESLKQATEQFSSTYSRFNRRSTASRAFDEEDDVEEISPDNTNTRASEITQLAVIPHVKKKPTSKTIRSPVSLPEAVPTVGAAWAKPRVYRGTLKRKDSWAGKIITTKNSKVECRITGRTGRLTRPLPQLQAHTEYDVVFKDLKGLRSIERLKGSDLVLKIAAQQPKKHWKNMNTETFKWGVLERKTEVLQMKNERPVIYAEYKAYLPFQHTTQSRNQEAEDFAQLQVIFAEKAYAAQNTATEYKLAEYLTDQQMAQQEQQLATTLKKLKKKAQDKGESFNPHSDKVQKQLFKRRRSEVFQQNLQAIRQSQAVESCLKGCNGETAADIIAYYDKVFSIYCTFPDFQALLKDVDELDTPKKVKKGLRQPIAEFPEFDNLYRKSKAVDDDLQAEWKRIVEHFKGEYIRGPLKTKESCSQKLDRKYDGDHTRLIDIVRGTGIFKHTDKLLQCIRALYGSFCNKELCDQFLLVDRFNKPASMSYRDLKFSVLCSDGYVCELQLHMDGFYVKKEELHVFYEQERVKGIRTKNSVDIGTLDETARAMILQMAGAQSELDKAKKAASMLQNSIKGGGTIDMVTINDQVAKELDAKYEAKAMANMQEMFAEKRARDAAAMAASAALLSIAYIEPVMTATEDLLKAANTLFSALHAEAAAKAATQAAVYAHTDIESTIRSLYVMHEDELQPEMEEWNTTKKNLDNDPEMQIARHAFRNRALGQLWKVSQKLRQEIIDDFMKKCNESQAYRRTFLTVPLRNHCFYALKMWSWCRSKLGRDFVIWNGVSRIAWESREDRYKYLPTSVKNVKKAPSPVMAKPAHFTNEGDSAEQGGPAAFNTAEHTKGPPPLDRRTSIEKICVAQKIEENRFLATIAARTVNLSELLGAYKSLGANAIALEEAVNSAAMVARDAFIASVRFSTTAAEAAVKLVLNNMGPSYALQYDANRATTPIHGGDDSSISSSTSFSSSKKPVKAGRKGKSRAQSHNPTSLKSSSLTPLILDAQNFNPGSDLSVMDAPNTKVPLSTPQAAILPAKKVNGVLASARFFEDDDHWFSGLMAAASMGKTPRNMRKIFSPAKLVGQSTRVPAAQAAQNCRAFEDEVARHASIPMRANIAELSAILLRGHQDVKGGKAHLDAMQQAISRIAKIEFVFNSLKEHKAKNKRSSPSPMAHGHGGSHRAVAQTTNSFRNSMHAGSDITGDKGGGVPRARVAINLDPIVYSPLSHRSTPKAGSAREGGKQPASEKTPQQAVALDTPLVENTEEQVPSTQDANTSESPAQTPEVGQRSLLPRTRMVRADQPGLMSKRTTTIRRRTSMDSTIKHLNEIGLEKQGNVKN